MIALLRRLWFGAPSGIIGIAPFVCASLWLFAPEFGNAQSLQGTTSDSSWIVASAAHVDLWYHGLATLGLEDEGALELYDPNYAAMITEEKRRRGLYPTKLDEIGSRLAHDIARWIPDDIIHFVPLYFATAGLAEMFEALHDVVDGRMVRRRSIDVQRGAVVMSLVLTSSRARGALSRFVSALEDEWEVFYEEYWRESLPLRLTQIQAVQSVWDQHFASRLEPFLSDNNLQHGILMITPTLGFEGRIVSDGDVPVASAVSILDPPQRAELSALLLLKELCYLAIDDATESAIGETGESAERTLQNLAVRCGELLIEQSVPELVEAYRDLFTLPFLPDATTWPSFDELYPVDEDLLVRLRADLFKPGGR